MQRYAKFLDCSLILLQYNHIAPIATNDEGTIYTCVVAKVSTSEMITVFGYHRVNDDCGFDVETTSGYLYIHRSLSIQFDNSEKK
jgi:hypothetical protein